MKVLKWILIAIVSLMLLVIGFVAFVLDLDSYKSVISDKVQEQTGRELVIDGDIGLSFFPTLGLDLQGVSLSNIPGESLPPMLKLNQASVGVALLPLLKKELQVESIVVDGAELTMVTLADGRSSVTGLGAAQGSESATAEQDQTSAPTKQANEWSLGLFQLNDLKLVNDNRITETVQTITVNQLQLNDLAPARSAPFKLLVELDNGNSKLVTEASSMLAFAKDFSHIQIDNWQQNIRIEGADAEPLVVDLLMQADVDLNKQVVALPKFGIKVAEFIFDAQGQMNYGGKVPRFSLTGSGNELDLTPFMAKSDGQPTESGEPEVTEDKPTQEPDLRGLAGIDADIDLSLKALIADNVRIDDINTKIVLKGGVLELEQLVGTTFDGDFKVTATLDGRSVPATYQFSKTLDGLQIQPLMMAFADSDKLVGNGNLSLSGKGKGLAGDALINNLFADGKLSLQDGALHGVNIAQMIRQGKAKFTGENVEQANEVKQTDFTNFDVGLEIRDGNLIVPELELASPLLRVSGDGQLGLIDQAIAMDLVVALVASTKGQGGKSTDQLADVPIPLSIGGTVAEPTYGVDFNNLKKELLDKEKDKLKDKLENKLKKKLFGG